jgi:hypothetical protein
MEAKVKVMQKKVVIISKMIRLKMLLNAQREELPVLHISGRGVILFHRFMILAIKIQVFRPI